MTVVAVFGFILSPYVIALFRRDDTDVIAIGSFAFRAQCISLPLSGFIVTANMYLQTIGRAKAATLTAMSRQFLFLFRRCYCLCTFRPYGSRDKSSSSRRGCIPVFNADLSQGFKYNDDRGK